MNTRLHIEELILEGFPPGDRYRIAAAVEAELARLFTETGIPPGMDASRSVPKLDAGSLDVAASTRPERVGGQVAQALYGGLAR